MESLGALILSLLVGASPSVSLADCGAQCRDRDRDGVVDDVDRCDDSDPGAPVMIDGCAHDSDDDGVPDYRDDCPNESSQSLDPWGCPMAIEIPLAGVSFAVDSAQLLDSSRGALDEAVAELKRYTDLRAEVVGHTDDRGSASHNRWLSRQRAEAVRRYLVDAGLDAHRIVARGYGESRPVADNETETGRSLNRRVVLRITGGRREAAGD